ncbi:MAG: xylulose kinase [Chloroflexi bacterium]|nr:xylulose kinase [Chloroflexota bacterium]
MTEQYLIGVDLGTGATKAALYRRDGTLVAEAMLEVPIHHQPGVVTQDMDDFYTTACRAIRMCIEQSGIDPRRIAAVGFDSQMAGVGALDESFRSAAPFDSWLDMRCQPYIDYLAANHADAITRLTGCPPTCDHGPKIMWSRDTQPDVYRRTAKFVMPSCYVAGRMARLKPDDAFIDYTFIHFSALSDAQQGSWSSHLIDVLGVDGAKLPRIVAPWTVIGEVREEAARDSGLAVGTPLVAGAGDTAAGALGAGIVKPGMLFDTAGTASVLAASTDQFCADTANGALLVMRSVIDGLWTPLAYIAGGGLALRWFRDTFYDSPETDAYERMGADAAAIAPGADGLFFSPHLNGRICPANPHMRGAWVGFTWGHTRAHFYRAILEGVAFEYAYYLRILRELLPGLALTEARVIGGGAKSAVWNQIKADVLGVPVQRLQRSEFATWGSALIAGHGVGLYPDLVEAAQNSARPDGNPFINRPDQTALYAPLVKQYISWQGTFSTVFRENGGTADA